jgi:hypothetical protein
VRERERERRVIYRILLGETEGKRPFGIPRHTWEDSIETNFKQIG